ncbi:MAG TPA: copper oxidase [Candidatus Acidoferrales bacterium]
MDRSRRSFLRGGVVLGAGAVAAASAAASKAIETEQGKAQMASGMTMDDGKTPVHHTTAALKGGVRAGFLPVVTPDVADLPFAMDGGVKVFHLVAEPVKREIFPGKVVNLWGYNGSAPGPTIQAMQGDRVRIVVDNHLPEATSMHWHGFEIPFDMDGGPGLSQDPIPPGGRFVYEFTLEQEGTYFYHSHMAMQEMMGMIGAFIMHPKEGYDPPVDKDFAIILQEYAILPNNLTPNTMSMEYNWLTFNGKSSPASTPLIIRQGDRVRMRIINLGMDHHPIHLHGHQFVVTGTEGGRQPKTTWGPNNTVLVGVAQARTVEFVAKNPGDWMLHCHMPHHMMNQMSSMVGPMTRRMGMPAGAGMEEGMGMPGSGKATADENGPSIGRAMGVGSTMQQATSNGPLAQEQGQHDGAQHDQRAAGHGMQMQMEKVEVSKDANSVPGFPQDAFMEGPMMAMDEAVACPETYGLRAGWTGYMMGMMTLVRVLPDDLYEHIERLRQQAGQRHDDANPGVMPSMKMPQS